MIFVTFLLLIKTFFFLRVFRELSYLVTMMRFVFYDLRVFLGFYFILIWMCTLVFNIIEVGFYHKLDDEQKKIFMEKPTFPGKEYMHLPNFLGQAVSIIRISLGDLDFSEATQLEPFENILYWITWLAVVMMTCIVFLNFIIAEVGSSYSKVVTKLNGLFLKERAQLIKESEDMIFQASSQLNQALFPKYLITRE